MKFIMRWCLMLIIFWFIQTKGGRWTRYCFHFHAPAFMKRNISDADGATIQTKIMISCCWFSGFSVVGASWAFWSDEIQFIQPSISHIKLLNILKLPFHTDNDDDDDDTLVYCMEALLVTCSRAADIDNFWKYNGKY